MEEQECRQSAESILERRRVQNRHAQRKRRHRRAEMERKQREAQQDQERPESSTAEETSHQRCHQCRFHNSDSLDIGSAETKASATTQQHQTANFTSQREPSDKDREALSKLMAEKQDEFLSLPLSLSSPSMDLSHNYLDENGLYNEDVSLDLDFATQPYSEPHSNSSGVTGVPRKQQPLASPRPRTAPETPERPGQHPMRRWSTTTPSSNHLQVLNPVSPLATHNYNTPPQPPTTFAPSLTSPSPSPSSPTNNKGKTPLHILTERGSLKTVSLLLESAIDMDAPDLYGRTALHLAVLNGHVAVAAKLLKAGADTDIVDYKGVGPVHIAAEMENEEMILLLMREGADFGVGIGLSNEL